jgi:hypothetical protein
MRIYKSGWFAKFARKERVADEMLRDAVRRAEHGLVDADLGGGLIKQRVAREGEGKSGGFRTLVIFRKDARAVFVFGFAKNDRANLEGQELAAFKKAAKIILALDQARIDIEVEAGRLIEVKNGNEEL